MNEYVVVLYSLVTDDVLRFKIYEDTDEQAYQHAADIYKQYQGLVEMDYDLYKAI